MQRRPHPGYGEVTGDRDGNVGHQDGHHLPREHAGSRYSTGQLSCLRLVTSSTTERERSANGEKKERLSAWYFTPQHRDHSDSSANTTMVPVFPNIVASCLPNKVASCRWSGLGSPWTAEPRVLREGYRKRWRNGVPSRQTRLLHSQGGAERARQPPPGHFHRPCHS